MHDSEGQTARSPAKSVFLSYNHDDRSIVYLVVSLLKAAQVPIYWDQELRPGEIWEDVLLDWLLAADIAFVFWSSRSAASEWVRTEYELLSSQKEKPLVPVLLDDSPLPPELAERQAVDMGSVLDLWFSRDNSADGIAHAEVEAQEVAGALLDYLSGQSGLGILETLDTFDVYCALSGSRHQNDLGRYLLWRGEGVPAPLSHIYTE